MEPQTQQLSVAFLSAVGCDAWWEHSGSPGPCDLAYNHPKSSKESWGPAPWLFYPPAFWSGASTWLKAESKVIFYTKNHRYDCHNIKTKIVFHSYCILSHSQVWGWGGFCCTSYTGTWVLHCLDLWLFLLSEHDPPLWSAWETWLSLSSGVLDLTAYIWKMVLKVTQSSNSNINTAWKCCSALYCLEIPLFLPWEPSCRIFFLCLQSILPKVASILQPVQR